MGLRGEAFHAVLPWPIPVAVLESLVQEDWGGQYEGAWKTEEDIFYTLYFFIRLPFVILHCFYWYAHIDTLKNNVKYSC